MKSTRIDPASFFLVGLAILLGGAMRILQVAQLRFPINDGGMFYRMTTDLLRNSWRLPALTTYNAGNIPYAYPPLSFYLAGFLTSFFHWPLIDIFRVLPAVIATLTIPAVALLAHDLLGSRLQAALATLVFALMPASFSWLIMGGGISRSLGLLFSVLTLAAAYRLYTRPGILPLFTTASLGALTILSHPEAGLHTAAGALLLFLFFGRNTRGLIRSLIVAGAVVLLTAPWWATVLSQHGLGPILAASRTGGYSLQTLSTFLNLNNSEELFLTFMGCFAVLGIFVAWAKGERFLPLWLLVVILSEPRSAALYITPGLAMFVAITLDELVLKGIHRLESKLTPETPPPAIHSTGDLFAGRMTKIVFAYLLVYFLVSAFGVPFSEARSLVVLPGDLQAFGWIKANLPPGHSFVVLTGDQVLVDPTSEWFPTLTDQVSVATAQGVEWDAGRDFNTALVDARSLQACIFQGLDCLENWKQTSRLTFEYVYFSQARIQSLVDGPIAIPLEQALQSSGNYETIYATDGVVILKIIR